MSKTGSEFLDANPPSRSLAANVLVRDEPDDEEDDDRKGEDDEDKEDDEGYSE
jgi:predicted transcriptional regulator